MTRDELMRDALAPINLALVIAAAILGAGFAVACVMGMLS